MKQRDHQTNSDKPNLSLEYKLPRSSHPSQKFLFRFTRMQNCYRKLILVHLLARESEQCMRQMRYLHL